MKEAEKLVAEFNLRECLRLWLEAIRAGDYRGAEEVIQWRNVLRAALERRGLN